MKKTIRKLLLPLFLAAAVTAATGLGLLYAPDNSVTDALYNRPIAADDRIVVIGIDQRALEELGPWPWTRDVMAQVIGLLNADPENRPAVIGIDVMYSGTTQEAYDDALVKACQKGGNVVVAEAATFESRMVIEGDAAHLDRFAIAGYDSAFDALREAAQPAHINAMQDKDGVLRHAKLAVEPEGYGTVYSFAAQIYTDYCAANGLTPVLPEADANGFYYLPYTVAGGGFSDGISVADVLMGEVSGAQFAGKIVLIGPYAAGLQDQYITSIDRAQPMYGIEIQANAIRAMLLGLKLNEVSDAWQMAMLFAGTFLAAWFFLNHKLRWGSVGFVALLALWLATCALSKRFGAVLHVLWPFVGLGAAFIVALAIHYIRATLERKKVSDTFSRYVDPAIVNELMKEGTDALDLGGKLCDIAVLFVDIRGFTTMSEKLAPQEVVSILNRYLTLTTECVMRYEGTLDKYVGDCTMAIWNAPLKQPDYVMKACRAALDMVRGSVALSEELRRTYGNSVSFGIGVHFGQAVVGNIGTKMRMDFTAIGDTVNTAARLEANAPGGTIYVSRDVVQALEGRIKVTSKGNIPLKGKARELEIFTLDGLTEE